MGRAGPRHPLAQRPPREQLGRYAQRGPTFAPARRRSPAIPPPVEGEHLWVLLRWNVITNGQAHQIAQGKARVEPKDGSLIAGQVGCYWCHEGYADAAAVRCGAFDQPEEPAPAPLEPADEEAVPVEPPTPVDTPPPSVELVVQPDLDAYEDPVGALAQPMTETVLTR